MNHSIENPRTIINEQYEAGHEYPTVLIERDDQIQTAHLTGIKDKRDRSYAMFSENGEEKAKPIAPANLTDEHQEYLATTLSAGLARSIGETAAALTDHEVESTQDKAFTNDELTSLQSIVAHETPDVVSDIASGLAERVRGGMMRPDMYVASIGALLGRADTELDARAVDYLALQLQRDTELEPDQVRELLAPLESGYKQSDEARLARLDAIYVDIQSRLEESKGRASVAAIGLTGVALGIAASLSDTEAQSKRFYDQLAAMEAGA